MTSRNIHILRDLTGARFDACSRYSAWEADQYSPWQIAAGEFWRVDPDELESVEQDDGQMGIVFRGALMGYLETA